MAPVLKELNEELRGKAIVKFVDVWKNPDAAKDIPLKTIPTQFFFDKNGRAYVPQLSGIKFKKHYSQEAENEILFAAHEGGLDKDQILAVFEEMGIND
jgi:thioredoxin 1